MAMTKSDLLHIVRFIDLEKWSAHDAVFENMDNRFPLVPLSKVLKRVKEPVNIDDDTLYKRITVRLYGQGVLQRDELPGKEIGTKRQFLAHSGQLIISRIDARNGAFGIVPTELDGAIVTNDFWLFDVMNALPEYLLLVLSSDLFQKYWQTQSSGTTNRQRVSENDFLNSMIAMPSIKQQQELINSLSHHNSYARDLESQAQKAREEADKYLRSALSVSAIHEEIDNSLMQIFTFHDMSRWDVWVDRGECISTKYRSVPFSSLTVGKPLYGANEKAMNVRSDVRYIRITDINEDGSLGNNYVSASRVDAKYLLHENDFLIARSGNTVGKTFLYTPAVGKAIFAGYLVRYKINCEKAIPKYLLYYTKSSVFKQWIQSNKRIFGQPNINAQEYLSAPIILPPIEVQSIIVDKMQRFYDLANSLLSQSLEELTLGKKEFEEVVFGET